MNSNLRYFEYITLPSDVVCSPKNSHLRYPNDMTAELQHGIVSTVYAHLPHVEKSAPIVVFQNYLREIKVFV